MQRFKLDSTNLLSLLWFSADNVQVLHCLLKNLSSLWNWIYIGHWQVVQAIGSSTLFRKPIAVEL